MIDEIRAVDVALIRDATIRPSERLTVLTGETGAGKTALLAALKLLVGERADASVVREGAEALCVEGRVFLSSDDQDGVVVRRRVSAEGRGRIEMDGHMLSVRELAEQVGTTVDLCGQHEHQRLLDISTHVEMLDAFAGDRVHEAHAHYLEALEASRAAAAEVERICEMGRTSAERLEEARFVLGRIDEVDPKAGELDELEATLPRAEHAEALLRAAEESRELIADEGGIIDGMSSALQLIEGAARHDSALDEVASSLSSALIDIEDVAATLRDYRDSLDFDPEALDRMHERMAQLQGLMRSYGPGMADVFTKREEAAELVSAASDDGEKLRRAQEAAEAAEASLVAAADTLDAERAAAAPALAAEVTSQMSRMEMGGAEIEVACERLSRDAWSTSGPSRIEFMYRPGAGLSARPLRRIASGGEVSRVMLALKVVLGAADHVDTLVFDEVDAGVGGATAVALANVLADLSLTHQVIVVTHLAQVAVMANKHYVVSKSAGDIPETHIELVEGEERTREIARMLSGDSSEAALAHARELLASKH